MHNKLNTLSFLKKQVYAPCLLQLNNQLISKESTEYEACSFKLNKYRVLCRNAKITPKKTGQFVTLWKRNDIGITAPFDRLDPYDFFVVNTRNQDQFGQFIFPKAALIKQGVLSTNLIGGKRGIRVYPPWDVPTNKQAIKTQKWQLNYFLMIGMDTPTDLERATYLYADNT